MRLIYPPEGVLELEARPAIAHATSTTLEVNLASEWMIQQLTHPTASPLQLLLGTATGDDTRLLELVSGAGIDWATDALGLERLADRAMVLCRDLAELARKALAERREDLEELNSVAALLLGTDEWPSETPVVDALAALERLCEPVRVVPEYDLGAGRLFDTHGSGDLLALAAVELALRGRAGQQVVPCAHCRCLFVPAERTDELYCRRTAPGLPVGLRRCNQVGPQRRYHEALTEVQAAYRREYKRLDTRSRRGLFPRSALDRWRAQARDLLDQAEAEGWPVDRYLEALAGIAPDEHANAEKGRSS